MKIELEHVFGCKNIKNAQNLVNLKLPDYLTGRNSARPDYRIYQLNQICKNKDVVRRVEDSTSLTRDVRSYSRLRDAVLRGWWSAQLPCLPRLVSRDPSNCLRSTLHIRVLFSHFLPSLWRVCRAVFPATCPPYLPWDLAGQLRSSLMSVC